MQHSSTAIVIASYGRRGLLQTDTGPRPFLLKGRNLRAVCGDKVDWEAPDGDAETVVTAVHTRRNSLQRAASHGAGEVLAANLDTLVVTIAAEPKPDFFIADRFICAAELMQSRCLLVWNKADLQPGCLPELDVYRRLGYPVLDTSAATGGGLDTLRDNLATGWSMLVGQSGVGKSSLINQLVDAADLAIGQLSNSSREGRHTTTAAVAHRLNSSGWLVDSPGVRDFAPAISRPAIIQLGFREVVKLADGCRFADCEHRREPDCAVRAAVASGTIDARRYESYKRLHNLAAAQAEKNR